MILPEMCGDAQHTNTEQTFGRSGKSEKNVPDPGPNATPSNQRPIRSD